MDIIRMIEPNVGVNILEEDSEEENEAEKSSVKDESIFSTTHKTRFKTVKQGEPYRPSDPDKIKMSRSHYSDINQIRNYPGKSTQPVNATSPTLDSNSIRVEDSQTKDFLLANQRTDSQNFSVRRRSLDTIKKTKNAK